MKLISLLLAILTWFTIYAIQHNIRLGRPGVTVTKTLEKLPITVMKTAADIRAWRVIPSEVDIVVKGPPEAINSLTYKDVEVYINLTDVVEAQGLVKKVLVLVPPNVNIVEVKPPEVKIEPVK